MPENIDDLTDFVSWFKSLKRENKIRIRIGLRVLMKIERERLAMNVFFNSDAKDNITCSSTKISDKVLEKLLEN